MDDTTDQVDSGSQAEDKWQFIEAEDVQPEDLTMDQEPSMESGLAPTALETLEAPQVGAGSLHGTRN